jgi:hypothetical protein
MILLKLWRKINQLAEAGRRTVDLLTRPVAGLGESRRRSKVGRHRHWLLARLIVQRLLNLPWAARLLPTFACVSVNTPRQTITRSIT